MHEKNSKSVIACVCVLLLCLNCGAYYAEFSPLLIFTIFPIVVICPVAVILLAYTLARTGRLRITDDLISHAALIGLVTFGIPSIRYLAGGFGVSAHPLSPFLAVLLFACAMSIIAFLAGWLGMVQTAQFTRGRQLLFILLIMTCIAGSLSWRGGALIERGLGMMCCNVYGSDQADITQHPRVSLLIDCARLRVPLPKTLVDWCMGEPGERLSDPHQDTWIYRIEGYDPPIEIHFTQEGHLADLEMGGL